VHSKYLFLVPHADDEALGFGGTIAKLCEKGNEVTVAIVQAPNNSRAAKQLENAFKAKEILGYKDLDFISIPNDVFCNDLFFLKNKIEDYILSKTPTVIYTSFVADNHQDHKNLYRAVSIACRPSGPCKSVRTIFAGEIISSYDQSLGVERIIFTPNYYETLELSHINKKIMALEAYEYEIQASPHPRSKESIVAKSIVRGSESNSMYAEAFMMLRTII